MYTLVLLVYLGSTLDKIQIIPDLTADTCAQAGAFIFNNAKQHTRKTEISFTCIEQE